ncbi:MAG: hypothetical protein QXO70_03965 [Candidatus Pacearchaeota archaeon]
MNKKLIIAIGIILIITVAAGGALLLLGKKSVKVQNDVEVEEQINEISKEEIGLNLAMGKDGKRVILSVEKTDDITSLDYQLSYNSKDDIPRGAIGHIDVKIKGQPIKKEITLGTCSDVCHYDEDVSDIKLILKITKKDGKIYQAKASL